MLTLANTNASGRRRIMVVGIDDVTGEAAKSADPAVTQDQIEDILNAYATPAPEVRYTTIGWERDLTSAYLRCFATRSEFPTASVGMSGSTRKVTCSFDMVATLNGLPKRNSIAGGRRREHRAT